MKLVSIIIPVYKVEKYLNRCVESLVNQTYKKLEIILIDDGSPDNCPKICDEWAKKDKRIKVIHKINQGVSVARNIGLKEATGEYIGFVDSDDWIFPSMYEKLYNLIKETNSDIALCRSQKILNDGKILFYEKNSYEKIILNKDEFFKLLFTTTISLSIWNKLFTKEVLKNVFFHLMSV